MLVTLIEIKEPNYQHRYHIYLIHKPYNLPVHEYCWSYWSIISIVLAIASIIRDLLWGLKNQMGLYINSYNSDVATSEL